MVSVTPCHNYPNCYGKIVKAISLDVAQTEPMTCLVYDFTLQKYSGPAVLVHTLIGNRMCSICIIVTKMLCFLIFKKISAMYDTNLGPRH